VAGVGGCCSSQPLNCMYLLAMVVKMFSVLVGCFYCSLFFSVTHLPQINQKLFTVSFAQGETPVASSISEFSS
jgi:hypothetical protein